MDSFEALCVADLMTLDPIVVEADAPIETAEALLSAYRITGLPVVDQGRLVGVISRADLLGNGSPSISSLLRGHASRLRVAEVMSVPPITVPLTATLVEAARLMRDEHIHRLVATDDAGRPIGVLAASDYVTLIADGFPTPRIEREAAQSDGN
jgi:IMP dehydrogenase